MAYTGDAGVHGRYMYGGATGILAAGLANAAELFQFRWESTTHTCRIDRLMVAATAHQSAYFAAGSVILGVFRCKSWTVDGTGGTGLTPNATTITLKKRLAYPATNVGDGAIRIATTAALGGGTKTLDAAALAFVTGSVPLAAGEDLIMVPPVNLIDPSTSEDGAVHLSTNEGIIVQNVIVPATGTWRVSVILEWTELEPQFVAGL